MAHQPGNTTKAGRLRTPARILSVSRDMTQLFEAQEQQRLLNGELGHRLKNVLALVQSIANQTFRQADSIETANAVFAARLAALGKATNVLTSNAWKSAYLHDVVRAGLVAFGGDGRQISVDGPSVKLDAQIALALTLALHELTTNACKYGSLSQDSGKVSLNWSMQPGDKTQPARFHLEWRETGGPIVVAPTRKGFGSRMIERSLQSYFRGETVLDLPRTVSASVSMRRSRNQKCRPDMGQALPKERQAILIVDDEAIIRHDLVDFFEDEGFEVFEAEDADAAIALMAANPSIQVVLTDVNMPGSMDGVRLAQYIRDRYPPTILIIASGEAKLTSADIPARCMFIPKPFDPRMVLRSIGEAVRRADG